MFEIANTIVARDLIEKDFVCDLKRCQGACCVEGDSGAPLEAEEAELLEQEYPAIAPFLRPEGRAAIAAQSVSVIDPSDGERVTPLRDGKECAFTLFDEKGMALCGIEKAWQAGASSFRKPISCHLYPIRIRRYQGFEALNYDRWSICSPACTLGAQLQVPVYRFAKEALLRKYGSAWYDELDELAMAWQESKNQ